MTDQFHPPTLYETDERIAALVARMRKLIPRADSAPDSVVWRAAQIAVLHKLDPFSGDISIYSYYDNPQNESDWIVDVGIYAWRRAAQRQAKYTTIPRELTRDEITAIIGAHRDSPHNVGVELTLYRLDVAAQCERLNIPYQPTVARGFWLEYAFYVKSRNAWMPDTLANAETRLDKAMRRAERKALKIAFSLDYPEEDVIDLHHSDWAVLAEMERKAASEERFRQPIYRPAPNREPDGDLLWA